MPLPPDITRDNSTRVIRESFGENDPLWAIARAVQSIAITNALMLDRLNVLGVKVTEQQRCTNELLTAALKMAQHAPCEPGPCGMESETDGRP